MAQLFSDAARAELAATINDTDAALTIVSGGSLFPVANTGANAIDATKDWFKLVVQDNTGYEIIYVRTHASGSLTFSNLLRGQEGTTAREFKVPNDDGFVPVVGQRMTATNAERFEAAASAAGTSVTPAGSLSATNVQAALEELDTDLSERLELVTEANIPTTDQGPIYVAGLGPMEWTGSEYSPIGGGAKGGGGNQVFYENDQVITEDYTVTAGKNAGSFGPITIADGVTVTIPDGSTWTIV